MAKTKIFTVLGDTYVANGTYYVRFVMENNVPLFVLTDIFKSLRYKAPGVSASRYCKMLGLGKVVNMNYHLCTYVTTEEAEEIFSHLNFMTPDFREFWEDEVLPATNGKIENLKKKYEKAKEKISVLNSLLDSEIDKNQALQVEVEELRCQVAQFIKEREAIAGILGSVA